MANPIITVILVIAVLVISVILVVVKFAIDSKKGTNNPKLTAMNKFAEAGYTVTKQDTQILIDEKNQKWVCTNNTNMPILDFSDIINVELVENGIKYKSENGVLRAVTGGMLFGAAGAIVGASTAQRTQKATNIYILIYTKNMSFSTIRIDVFNRSAAEKLVGTINAMRELSRVNEPNNNSNASNSNVSVADEISKYKSLLDSGAITQEEYDKKKDELLNQ